MVVIVILSKKSPFFCLKRQKINKKKILIAKIKWYPKKTKNGTSKKK